MTEILNSIGQWFKEKTTSPLYGTFIFSVILWNWKFFYILFWQGSEQLGVPKIEYVQNSIINNQGLPEHILYFIILPSISTYFIIWWLPYVSNLAHRKHLQFFYNRKSIFDEIRVEYERNIRTALETISALKEKQAEAKKQIERLTTKSEQWEDEFESFKQSPLYEQMNNLKDVLYKHSGMLRVYANIGGKPELRINADIIAIADSKGLINITGSDIDEKIELTEKGKFFMKKYLEK